MLRKTKVALGLTAILLILLGVNGFCDYIDKPVDMIGSVEFAAMFTCIWGVYFSGDVIKKFKKKDEDGQ